MAAHSIMYNIEHIYFYEFVTLKFFTFDGALKF